MANVSWKREGGVLLDEKSGGTEWAVVLPYIGQYQFEVRRKLGNGYAKIDGIRPKEDEARVAAEAAIDALDAIKLP